MKKRSKIVANAGKVPPSGSLVTQSRLTMFMRSRFNPIRGLTPERLSYCIDSFTIGFLRDAALIWDTIENRDDTLISVVTKRRESPGRFGWEIITDDESQEAEDQKVFLEYLFKNLSSTDALDRNQLGGIKLLLTQMMDSVGKRYAVHELIWRPNGDNLTVEARKVPLWFFENTTGRLRYLPSEGNIYGVDLEDDGWMVTCGRGLMEAASIAYMFKTMPLKDWVNYSERFGMPGVMGKTNASPGSPEWDAVVQAVENFGAEFAAVMNQGTEISTIDLKGAGNLPYPPLVERMDRVLATIFRGADLSTHSKENAVGASQQGGETEIFDGNDADVLEETININIARVALRYRFGTITPLARFRVSRPPEKATPQDLAVDTFLATFGAPIGIADAMKRYGRPMPQAGEAILKAPTPTGAAPAPADTLGNAAPAAVAGSFQATAMKQFAAANASYIKPVADRLNAILKGPDARLIPGLKKLANDLPVLAGKAGATEEAIAVWQRVIGTALASGLAVPPPEPLTKSKSKK